MEKAADLGADLQHVYHWWHLASDADIDKRALAADPFPLLLRHLDEVIRHQGPVDLIICEPLPVWLNLNLNSYHRPVPALRELNHWLAVHNCGLLGTHHVDKARKDERQQFARPIDRINGSTSLNAHAHAVWILERAPEFQFTRAPSSSQARLTVVQRRAPDQTIWLDRDPDGSGRWVLMNNQAGLTGIGLTPAQAVHARALLLLLSHQPGPTPYRTLKVTLGPPLGLTRDILEKLAPVLESLTYLSRGPQGWAMLPAGQAFLETQAVPSATIQP